LAGHADGVTLKTIVSRSLSAASLVFAFLASSALFAQHAPLPLCLVQTKPYPWNQYDPPAGPWAAEMYDLLSGQKLANGASLRMTVLAAATEKDVPPEVRRLQCRYVVQLRYHGSLGSGGRSPGKNEDSVLFALWQGATGRVLSNGAVLIPGEDRHPSKAAFTAACAGMAQQILKGLNKLQ
jgi:hypothetical protein